MLWLTLTALASPPAHIVGGDLTLPEDWPSVAALYRRGAYSCTGVLIAPDVILTAGHCGRLLTDARVNTSDSRDDAIDALSVADVVIYPDHLDTLDLALVLLETPSTEQPSPLLRGCLADYLTDGSEATIVGYGASNRFGTAIDGLQRQALIPVLDADCDNPTRGCNVAVLPGGETIAGGDGIDSCNGDSGGPLFLQLGDDPYVAGIVSRAALPADSSCGDGGIYTRVNPAIEWIEAETGLDFGQADCTGLPLPNNRPELHIADVDGPVTQTITLDVSLFDADGDPLTLSIAVPPINGTVDIVDLSARYTPNSNVRGANQLTLRVVDDADPPGSATATVSVMVDTVQPEPEPEPEPEAEPEEARGCACTHSPAPWRISWLLPLWVLWRRRLQLGPKRKQ